MIENYRASLTWKLRQGGVLVEVSQVLPAEVATRVASTLLREFAGRRFAPYELDVTGEVRRFSYQTDSMVLLLRRLKTEAEKLAEAKGLR